MIGMRAMNRMTTTNQFRMTSHKSLCVEVSETLLSIMTTMSEQIESKDTAMIDRIINNKSLVMWQSIR